MCVFFTFKPWRRLILRYIILLYLVDIPGIGFRGVISRPDHVVMIMHSPAHGTHTSMTFCSRKRTSSLLNHPRILLKAPNKTGRVPKTCMMMTIDKAVCTRLWWLQYDTWLPTTYQVLPTTYYLRLDDNSIRDSTYLYEFQARELDENNKHTLFVLKIVWNAPCLT